MSEKDKKDKQSFASKVGKDSTAIVKHKGTIKKHAPEITINVYNVLKNVPYTLARLAKDGEGKLNEIKDSMLDRIETGPPIDISAIAMGVASNSPEVQLSIGVAIYLKIKELETRQKEFEAQERHQQEKLYQALGPNPVNYSSTEEYEEAIKAHTGAKSDKKALKLMSKKSDELKGIKEIINEGTGDIVPKAESKPQINPVYYNNSEDFEEAQKYLQVHSKEISDELQTIAGEIRAGKSESVSPMKNMLPDPGLKMIADLTDKHGIPLKNSVEILKESEKLADIAYNHTGSSNNEEIEKEIDKKFKALRLNEVQADDVRYRFKTYGLPPIYILIALDGIMERDQIQHSR